MKAEERYALIKARLTQAFSPSYLEVMDESHQHLGHKGHGGAGHFAVIIKAVCFQRLSRLDIHRQIYGVLDDVIPNEIHALKITVMD